ncbi:MAG TPA: MmcQ/YjbR family DNA-binding protein [Anaerolineae bacterium]
MKLEALRTYLLDKKGTTEETPFGPEALVFKVMGKMFALIAWQESPLSMNLKCDPELALSLRERYAAITPGYHMNKKHWNTIRLDGTVPAAEIWSLIDLSYDLVVKGFKKAERQKLENL